MKRYFLILFLAFSFLLLVSCKEEEFDFSSYVSSFEIDTSISSDIILPTEGYINGDQNDLIAIKWESDDESVLTNDGKVTYYLEEMYANLTATFSYQEVVLSKTFSITLLPATIDTIFEAAKNEIVILESTSEDITLPTKIKYGDIRLSAEWHSSDANIINTNGIFNYPEADKDITLSLKLSYKEDSEEFEFSTKALALNKAPYEQALEAIEIPNELDENYNLQKDITIGDEVFDITWESKNPSILSNDGKISFVANDTNVDLVASIQVKNIIISHTFTTVIKPMSGMTAIELCLNSIKIPSVVSNDLLLETEMNGVILQWTSSKPELLSNTGKISKTNKNYQSVTLTLTLIAGKVTFDKEYNCQVAYESHMFIDRTFEGSKENVQINNGKLVLEDNKLNGVYTTDIIECEEFDECVGSYSAISSTTETCELKVRIRINNTWSKYFTYGEFGLGRKNGYSNQTDTLVKMVEDEIMTTSTSNANAFQLQLSLKRSSADETGPVVSLLALSIDYVNHDFNVDITSLPKEYKNDVPKLCQNVVPEIGGSICSITSSTMLLMYKGHDFSDKDTYPHRYIAALFKDYGHGIYGNWSYNCIGMGAFGENAYVKRFYSYQEILYYLYYVGPMAASIKGNMISDSKTYNTNGHLIVVTGYLIEGNDIYIYINDPNNSSVATRCTLENFLAVNRMVSYIVE